MKPISIELQAFGPFAKTENIDFESLSRDGLFLIRGKTGSGKSMILDAICYALFGKSSGENRDSLEDLRCNRCDPDIPTYVRFIFEEKNKRYAFERMLKKARKNFSASAGAYVLNNQGVWEPLLENPREKEITGKAEEIIGLTFDQFRQVIILPQGKFEKLLTSKSNDKEDILASIFGTEKWQVMADNYFKRAKKEKERLDEIKIKIRSRLADEGCSDMEELKEKIQLKSEQKAEEERSFNEKDYGSEEKLLKEQIRIHDEFGVLRGHMSRKEELEKRTQSIENKKRTISISEKAEPLRKPLEEMKRAQHSFEMRKKDEERAQLLKENSEEQIEKAKRKLIVHIEEREKYERWKKEYECLELKKPFYESIQATADKKNAAEKKYEAAVKELASEQEVYNGYVSETEKLYRSYEEALDTHRSATENYMNGIVGSIAAELEEGRPCPVCGSTSHPHKAKKPEGSADMDYIKLLEETMDQRRKNWKYADENRIRAEKTLNEKKSTEMQLKSERDVVEAEYMRISEGLISGIDSLEQLGKKMTHLKVDIAGYEDDEKRLEENVRKAEISLKGMQTSWENALNELEKAEKQYAAAKSAWKVMIENSDFESAQDAEKAMVTPEERGKLAGEIGEHEGKLTEIRKLIEECRSALEGVEEPDISRVNCRLAEISIEREKFNKHQGALIREIERMTEKVTALEKEQQIFDKEIQKAESDMTFARSLRGDTGIGLQRYVLGIMFSSVISAANEMLQKVHGGRYRLYRTDEKVAGSNKKGLDLKVHDSYSEGTEGRSVSTLSGGEKFLASLALSLGMSAVARSGGVHIEGLFIDEGFGTLDENSVEDALDVLKSIRQMNGSVGIISHMDVLGANIPSQLLVQKEKETSTIRLV